jgi:hypothetical protein
MILVVASASPGAAGQKPSARKAPAPEPSNSCATCTERRPVLDSKRFSDTSVYEKEVVPAYEIARKHPATLDRLHCFCECQESMRFRHRTLLTCFTDDHAAGCGICLREALMAGELKQKGFTDEEIENLIESSFKTDGHRATHGAG